MLKRVCVQISNKEKWPGPESPEMKRCDNDPIKLFVLVFLFASLLLVGCRPKPTPNDTSRLSPNLNESTTPEGTQTILGHVVGVNDGDTITVYDGKEQHRIRLAGIDAPESDQAFGQESKRNLSSMVLNRTVTVFTHKTDQNGRPVGKVICEGTDVNLEQVKAGLAWHFKQYQNEQSQIDRTNYADAEATAKAARLGLWADSKAIPPRDHRNANDANNIQSVPEGAIIGNRNSLIYHTPGCSTYGKVSPKNQMIFKSVQEAEAAGYRRAKNCKGG
ncbi:MAG: thermonuclease family protein [Pyrinomonadaceae bacterium]